MIFPFCRICGKLFLDESKYFYMLNNGKEMRLVNFTTKSGMRTMAECFHHKYAEYPKEQLNNNLDSLIESWPL